jgi:hypothetical protein
MGFSSHCTQRQNLEGRLLLWVLCGRRRLGKNFLSCRSIGQVSRGGIRTQTGRTHDRNPQPGEVRLIGVLIGYAESDPAAQCDVGAFRAMAREATVDGRRQCSDRGHMPQSFLPKRTFSSDVCQVLRDPGIDLAEPTSVPPLQGSRL